MKRVGYRKLDDKECHNFFSVTKIKKEMWPAQYQKVKNY